MYLFDFSVLSAVYQYLFDYHLCGTNYFMLFCWGNTRCKSIFFELEMMKKTACVLKHNVWDVIVDETASAVRYGFKGACFYFLPFSKSIDVLFFLND
jgi:hypothetical protein